MTYRRPRRVPPTGCSPTTRSSLGDQVIVCDEQPDPRLQPERPPRGRRRGRVGLGQGGLAARRGPGGDRPRGAPGTRRLPRFTLTALGDRIYARMGADRRPPSRDERAWAADGSAASRAATSSRSTAATEGKMLWKKPAAEVALPRRRADGGEPEPRVRGDARGRRPERLRRADRPPRADGDLRRLPRRRDRRDRAGSATSAPRRRRREHVRHGHGHGPRRGDDSATACSPSTARPSITRRTSAPSPRSTPRPAAIRWVATYPRQDRDTAAGRTTAT